MCVCVQVQAIELICQNGSSLGYQQTTIFNRCLETFFLLIIIFHLFFVVVVVISNTLSMNMKCDCKTIEKRYT